MFHGGYLVSGPGKEKKVERPNIALAANSYMLRLICSVNWQCLLCLEGEKIEGRKMLDFFSKAAILMV